ncbi:hypothetical protein Tery_3124 [Trichodesmium erythraeum IMS101]|uniref:TauD/TfdA-like domain-containing protein n=1 Tax=Trichodesmium erythraeum (strain IMS101) TaxID=203124 RepID=Q10ZR8_TRIEI
MNKTIEILNIPSAWKGEELFNSTYWNYRFTNQEIAEIETAFKKSQISKNKDINLSNSLLKTFKDISEELEFGSGIVLLKGIPVHKYLETDLSDLYLALSRKIGVPIRESNSDFDSPIRERNQFITEIKAEAKNSSQENKQSNDAFKFHTDRCDLNSLLCVRQARIGGENRLASAITIYNEMLKYYPDIAQELFKEIPFFFEGENNWITYPLWCIYEGKFTTQYSSGYVALSQLIPDCPRLTQKQKQGLDLLEEIGLKVGITMKLEPGDWFIANNHIIYHARSTWEIESGDYDRLLLRVWLSPSNSRKLPDTSTFKTMWGNVGAGKPRGGFLPNHYHTSPDRPITQPLSPTESYWLAQFMKGRWRGADNINNEQLT